MRTLVASLLLSAFVLVGCASDGPPPLDVPNPLDNAANSPDATLTPNNAIAVDPPAYQPPAYDPGFEPPAYTPPAYTTPSYTPPTYTPPAAGGYPAPPPVDYTAPAPEAAPGGSCGAGGSS